MDWILPGHNAIVPMYNTNLVSADEAPKSWEDLLDPKFKGGKLGQTTATHHLARLATFWGEEKTTAYVKALARQEPALGRMGEMYSRLQLGEILVAVTLTDGYIYRAKKKRAPIVHAEGIEPVISPAYNAGVLKGARHPNVGHLFAIFLAWLIISITASFEKCGIFLSLKISCATNLAIFILFSGVSGKVSFIKTS